MLNRRQYGWLALGAVLLTIHGSLLPFRYRWRPFEEALAAFRDMRYVEPSGLQARGDWIISVLLYAALGFLLMGAWCADRRWWSSLAAVPPVVSVSAVLAVLLEFAQVYFPPRTVSINDLVLEIAGGLFGAVVWLAVGQPLTRWCRRLGSATGLAGLAARLLPAYVVILLVIELMPFDLTLSWLELRVKYQEGKLWPLPFQAHAGDPIHLALKTAITAACFFPLGFLNALRDGKGSWAGLPEWRVLLYTLAAAAGVELLQVFIYSRYADATDILVGSVGGVLGWRLGLAVRQGVRRSVCLPGFQNQAKSSADLAWLAVGGGWLAGLLYLSWRPFDFDLQTPSWWQRICWVPLADYYWSSKFNLFDQLVLKSLAFGPLGALVAVRVGNLYSAWAEPVAVLLGVAVAAGVELGKCFLPSHLPSVTDLCFAGLGTWVGFRLARHVRAVLWAEIALHGWVYEVDR